jgi:tetratricopeptide (TPR) repeat protein
VPNLPRGKNDVLVMGFLVALMVVGLAFVAGATVVGRAWWLHRAHRYEDEIAWLEATRALAPLDAGLDAQIARLYRERVRYELDQGTLPDAVKAFRVARTQVVRSGRGIDKDLMALGIECYTRAADHVKALGRLSAAADWDDSLFVLAVRASEPHHRYAATAAFMEGLDLRVQDGQPCAALARVEWAKRGLGGVVPQLPPEAEPDLARQCDVMRRAPGR